MRIRKKSKSRDSISANEHEADKENPLQTLLNADEKELEIYLSYIEAGVEAMEKGMATIAETWFRMGHDYAEKIWGPYSWMVSDALEQLSYSLESQKRLQESNVAQSLADRIAGRSGS